MGEASFHDETWQPIIANYEAKAGQRPKIAIARNQTTVDPAKRVLAMVPKRNSVPDPASPPVRDWTFIMPADRFGKERLYLFTKTGFREAAP